VRGTLAELFPEAPAPARPRQRRWLIVLSCALAVVAGAAVSLARYTGTPPWKSVYAEDYPVYLVEALAHPWRSIFMADAGYEQLLPRLIGQFVSFLPMRDAAAGFAIIGALVTAGVAVFVYFVSDGHVRSTLGRVLLALSVLLLPTALLQLSNNDVNIPWYLEIALFWALLWRPRSGTGMAVAALAGFFAASSNITATIFVLLVAIRLAALPRVREHAVTAGWLAGCLVQLPYFLHSGSSSGSRLSHLATPGQMAGFYGHDVLLPAFGWHMSWLLRHWVGRNYGVLITGGLIAIATVVVLITGSPRVRVFVVTALGFGFVFTAFASTVTWWVTVNGVKFDMEPGARYTALPILLIAGAAIVALDAKFGLRLSRDSLSRAGIPAAVASLGLVAVLCVGWFPDFRYQAARDETQPWAPIVAQWQRVCEHHPVARYKDGYADYTTFVIPCSRIR
jgi:hypothetical protein